MRFSHRFASIGRKILILQWLFYNIENIGLRGILIQYEFQTWTPHRCADLSGICSVAPSGLAYFPTWTHGLRPGAAFLRRFAAVWVSLESQESSCRLHSLGGHGRAARARTRADIDDLVRGFLAESRARLPANCQRTRISMRYCGMDGVVLSRVDVTRSGWKNCEAKGSGLRKVRGKPGRAPPVGRTFAAGQ